MILWLHKNMKYTHPAIWCQNSAPCKEVINRHFILCLRCQLIVDHAGPLQCPPSPNLLICQPKISRRTKGTTTDKVRLNSRILAKEQGVILGSSWNWNISFTKGLFTDPDNHKKIGSGLGYSRPATLTVIKLAEYYWKAKIYCHVLPSANCIMQHNSLWPWHLLILMLWKPNAVSTPKPAQWKIKKATSLQLDNTSTVVFMQDILYNSSEYPLRTIYNKMGNVKGRFKTPLYPLRSVSPGNGCVPRTWRLVWPWTETVMGCARTSALCLE